MAGRPTATAPRTPNLPGGARLSGRSSAVSSPAVAVAKKARPSLSPPERFKVLLHNDDFTTMEFVVAILKDIFGQSPDAAQSIMLDVHHRGVGLAGIYPFEVAEAKAQKVVALARAQDFPFLATLEPEETPSAGE